MAAVRALPDRSPFRVIEVLQYRADDRGYERGYSKATENAEDIS